jgi:hypothetical protein
MSSYNVFEKMRAKNETVREYAKANGIPLESLPLKYKPGDRVIFLNDYGMHWGERIIKEFDPGRVGECYFTERTDTPGEAWWCAHQVHTLYPLDHMPMLLWAIVFNSGYRDWPAFKGRELPRVMIDDFHQWCWERGIAARRVAEEYGIALQFDISTRAIYGEPLCDTSSPMYGLTS